MAITFDNIDEIREIFRYDASATAYIGITHRYDTTVAAFDYFDNNATVGDYIAFGWDYGAFHDLTVNVGTAIAGTGITGVWEWSRDDGTWQALTCTDNTVGFTVTGVNSITFTIPDRMANRYFGGSPYGGIGGSSYMYAASYIRYRITAITTITEGGANATNKPTCKDYSIKLDGGTLRMSDILAADVAGGWGVVTQTGNYFLLTCHLWIGDKIVTSQNATNATTLAIRGAEQVEVGTSVKYRSIRKCGNTTLTLGNKSGTTYSEGSALRYWNQDASYMYPYANNYNSWYGNLNIYSSILSKRAGGFNDPQITCVCDIQNSIICGHFYYFLSSSGSCKNTTWEFGNNRGYDYSGSLTLDNILLTNCTGIVVGSTNVTIANINFGTSLIFQVANSAVTAYAKDCSFSNYYSQVQATSSNDKAIVNYTLTFVVTDIAGVVITNSCTIYLKSALGTLSWGYSGMILRAIEYWNTAPTTEWVVHNPYTLTISCDGYETYSAPLTLGFTTKDIKIKLRHAMSPGRDAMGAEFK